MAEAQPDSPNPHADLDNLNQEQLVSVVKGLRGETERKAKLIDELQSTVDAQATTISDQSETLMNREQVVEKLKLEVEQANNALHELKNDVQQHQGKVAPADVGDLILADLIAALEQYGINCGKIANSDGHNAIAVTFIQVANHLRTFEHWQHAMDWLNGKPTRQLPTS